MNKIETLIENLLEKKLTEMLDGKEIKSTNTSSVKYPIGKHVLLSTDNTKRGVFKGILKSYDEDKKIAVLDEAQMVISWSSNCKGYLGLKKYGPVSSKNAYSSTKTKVTEKCGEVILEGVTNIGECTKEAVKQFDTLIWEE